MNGNPEQESIAVDVSNRASVAAALRRVIPADSVLDSNEELRPYECDGLSAYRELPMVVALPSSIEEVQAVLGVAHDKGIPVVTRGAGTSLSGGALPRRDGILMSLARLNRILDIDPIGRTARV